MCGFVVGSLGCCWGVVIWQRSVQVPHPGASIWIPSALFHVAGIRLVGTALAGSSVPRLPGRTVFVARVRA